MGKKIFIYDFDGTLTPYPITKVGVLETIGFEGGMMSPKFMGMVRERRLSRNLDLYTACYQVLLEVLKENNISTTKENFGIGAKDLEYNPGVYEFLEKITSRGFDNYLISSSAKPFLDQTEVAKFFKKIYATTFKYDENGEAIEADFLMSDKRKVEIIKKILSDNGYKDDDCRDLVYVGDGLTDLYAMEYIKNNGGETIFVYLDEESDSYKSAKEVDVVSYYAKADYCDGSDLSIIFDDLCREEN